jgi:hypothetical protein
MECRAAGDLYDGLHRGEFCYVLAAPQMGQSFLMVRTLSRIREEGRAVVVLSLAAMGYPPTAEEWYRGLLDLAGRQLGLEAIIDELWRKRPGLGPLQRWMRALREILHAWCPGQLVIFIDGIDAVRALPFSTDELFAGIRACYNQRAEDEELARLTFCLLGAASPTELIRGRWSAPFNIGRRIELDDRCLHPGEVISCPAPTGSGREAAPA